MISGSYTGAVVYAGGGLNEQMANTRKWNTGIVARGRIYFAASNKVYAFTVPAVTPTPTPTATPTPTPALRGLTYSGGTPFVNGTILIRGTSYTATAQANASTRSVVFKRDGVGVKTDSATPFDSTWTPTAIGTHTLVATPWSLIGGTGTSGAPITVNFNVVEAPRPAPTPTPTAAKRL